MSHAPKIGKSEGQLDFREGATTLHNKVCAPSNLPTPFSCPDASCVIQMCGMQRQYRCLQQTACTGQEPHLEMQNKQSAIYVVWPCWLDVHAAARESEG